MSFYTIDRFEGSVAVIVADDGRTFDVASERLPRGCREGSVLRLAAHDDRAPDWSGAVIDEWERVRRLARARETLRRLSQSDPGGDIVL